MNNFRIITGDAKQELEKIESESVQCCVTSPPYWGLRDYKTENQMGLEASPELYVNGLLEVFRQVKRVLKEDGTLWINLGDSYASNGKDRTEAQANAKKTLSGPQSPILKQQSKITSGLKPKDLVGIPWMVAFALRADGWYLRSDIIWAKPNPMPESVTDRPTKSHEYIFLLSKSVKYYYDAEAIMENLAESTLNDRRLAKEDFTEKRPERGFTGYAQKGSGMLKPRSDKQRDHSRRHAGFNDRWDKMEKSEQQSYGRNKRSVWNVATQPFKEAHFATYPPKLIEPCILAGSRPGDLVLDIFAGAGTTGLVSLRHGRKFLGIELNPEYAEMAKRRIQADSPLLNHHD